MDEFKNENDQINEQNDDQNNEIIHNVFINEANIEKRRKYLMDKIDELYMVVIDKFKKGELVVYNPDILSKLTKEKFITWIIMNNDDIADILLS